MRRQGDRRLHVQADNFHDAFMQSTWPVLQYTLPRRFPGGLQRKSPGERECSCIEVEDDRTQRWRRRCPTKVSNELDLALCTRSNDACNKISNSFRPREYPSLDCAFYGLIE
jgi:hypothetical protein